MQQGAICSNLHVEDSTFVSEMYMVMSETSDLKGAVYTQAFQPACNQGPGGPTILQMSMTPIIDCHMREVILGWHLKNFSSEYLVLRSKV